MKPADVFTDQRVIELYEAATRGDGARVRTLVSAGVGPNASGRQGVTPLMVAVANQDSGAIALFMEHGANASIPSEEGDSAISLAAGAENPDMLRTLLESNADPNTKDLGTPVTFIAMRQQRDDNLRRLLDGGADINATDGTGVPLVVAAARIARFDLVEQLLKRGADHTIPTDQKLASIVERRRADPGTPAYEPKQRVIELLRDRGVAFPVSTNSG